MRKTLRATKSLRYGTRRMQPGDEFEASGRDAHILLGMRNSKVEAVDAKGNPKVPTPPASYVSAQGEPTTSDDAGGSYELSYLDQLRNEAQELGIVTDGRWGASRLRSEINAKRRSAE